MTGRYTCCRLAVICAIFALSGCGGDDRQQKTYAVRGRVVLDGKPFKGAFVALIPKDASKFVMNERPQATTDEDGQFQFSTYATSDGAPTGDYWVGIDSPSVAVDDGSDQVVRTKRPGIPVKYNMPQKSGIEVTVLASANELAPFELTTAKK